MCVNCGRVAMSECTGCHKVNYCSTFCQRKVRLTWTILWSKVQFFKKLKYPFQECRRNTKDVANVVNPSYCFKSYPFFLFVCFGVGSFFFLLLNQWQFGISKTRHRFVFFPLQDWKDHQHTCCQSAGGVAVQEEEPITAMDMDKVKWSSSKPSVRMKTWALRSSDRKSLRGQRGDFLSEHLWHLLWKFPLRPTWSSVSWTSSIKKTKTALTLYL